MIAFFAYLISSIVVDKPGYYEHEMEDTFALDFNFSNTDQYEYYLIPDKYSILKIDGQPMKQIIEAKGNHTISLVGYALIFRYSVIQINKRCFTFDFIYKPDEGDKYIYELPDLEKNKSYCSIFYSNTNMSIEANISKETNTNHQLNIYDGYTMRPSIHDTLTSDTVLSKNYNTTFLIVEYITSTDPINPGSKAGVTIISPKSSGKLIFSLSNICHYFRSMVELDFGAGYEVVFYHGDRTLNVSHTLKVFPVVKNRYIVFYNFTDDIEAVAVVGDTRLNFLGKTGIVGVSFLETGYVTIACTSNASQLVYYTVFNNVSLHKCERTLTIAGKQNYETKFKKNTNVCVYSAVGTTQIKNPPKKYETFLTSGKEVSPNSKNNVDSFEDPCQMSFYNSSNDIDFHLLNPESIDIGFVVDNKNRMSYQISSEGVKQLYNNNSTTPPWLIAIYVLIGISLMIIVILVIIFLWRRRNGSEELHNTDNKNDANAESVENQSDPSPSKKNLNSHNERPAELSSDGDSGTGVDV